MRTFVYLVGAVLAASCQIGLPLEYSPSRQYNYHYSTNVRFNEPGVEQTSQPKKDVGFLFTSKVSLTPLWNTNNKMLIRMELTKPHLHSVAWEKTKLEAKSLVRYPLLFHWEGSRVMKVYTSSKEPDWASNMKIAIASLMMLRRDSSTRQEVDISGACDVEYVVAGTKITKTKTNCKPTHSLAEYDNVQKLLGVTWQGESRLEYDIQDELIKSVIGTENYSSYINLQDNIASHVSVSQSLILDGMVSSPGKLRASSLEEAVAIISAKEKLDLQGNQPFARSVNNKDCCQSGQCKQFEDLVAGQRESLRSIATTQSATAYLRLMRSARDACKSSIAKVLNDPRNEDVILPLIDIISAAQTDASQAALMDFLDFSSTYDIRRPERYLLAAAFSTHPKKSLLSDLFALYKRQVTDERLQDSIGDAMGAVIYTYIRQGQSYDKKLVKDIERVVVERLARCSGASCQSMQLRVLGNAGLPGTLPVLMTTAENSRDTSVAESALKALRRIDPALLTPQIRASLLSIYQQTKRGYNNVVRTAAMSVLLTGLSEPEVAAILAGTDEPGQGEMAMFVQARLQTVAENNQTVRQYIKNTLKKPAVGNYDVMAPKGKTLAFKEQMAETASALATYDMFVENGKSGVLKRSGLDVSLHSATSSQPVLGFGIFAAGLEGLLGEEVPAEEADIEATAGLALNLLDVSLRPVSFFTGQSGLMSAVWNAPSSLVSALQANVLMQDASHHIPLINGLLLSHTVQGAVSLDLSGLVSISLWSKYCNSLIKNSGALVIEGSLGIDTSAFKTGITYKVAGSSVIDFETYVDFYDKIQMCLQMGRPASNFRHQVNKYEWATGLKKGYQSHIERVTAVHAASYPLPKPNNEQCRNLMQGK